ALVVGTLGFRVYGALSLLAGGERVDIGGRHIFIACSGFGSPTVILEHGLGANGFDWKKVQDTIDDTTRVCYTSRAGMGFSDPAPGDGVRIMQDAVDDLSAVLAAAEVPGPYVLVGHSAGGFVVRLFADQHPGEVVGMVLVDSTHEDQTARLRAEVSPKTWSEVSGFFGSDNSENMDLEASSAQAAAAGDLGDMPLVVLEAGQEEPEAPPPGISQAAADEVNAVLRSLGPELQLDLAELSTNGTHILVRGSGHFIQLDRPDAVIDAINSILGE
ncbi:MAG: alpha/beta hydrolase, partial [Acidimicrobiia bacterium]|nr:alpha/beta hydrolase [Acidimicrobiia bacterium]